jgi:hypothetical protein
MARKSSMKKKRTRKMKDRRIEKQTETSDHCEKEVNEGYNAEYV